jgi:hypothetical protein
VPIVETNGTRGVNRTEIARAVAAVITLRFMATARGVDKNNDVDRTA